MKVNIQYANGTAARSLQVEVHVSSAEIHLRQTQLGVHVALSDALIAGHLNGPGLPEKLLSVALPAGTRVAKLTAVVRATKSLTTTATVLAPVEPSHRVRPNKLLRRSAVKPSLALYRADAKAPRPLARLIDTQYLGDIAVAQIAFSPVLFNKDQTLGMVTHCEITLQLAPLAQHATAPQVVSKAQQERFAQLARVAVLNPEQIAPGAGPQLAPLPFATDHLIITDNHTWDAKTFKTSGSTSGDLVAAFQQLADWRTQSGLKSRVVTVSDIVNKVHGDFTTGARDLQHAIRKFLAWAYTNWGVAYVLLGGSHRVVPVRSLGGLSWLTTLAPSDFYYTNLSAKDDWAEEQVVDCRAADYGIHLGLGRIALESAAQATIFVNKVIDYERLSTQNGTAIAQDYLRRLLVAATSWNRELRVDVNACTTFPPLENSYFHAPGSAFAVIKLYELLLLPRCTPNVNGQNPDPNTYTHFANDAFSKLHLLEAATYKEVQDVIAVFSDGRQQILTYRKDAGPAQPGWYFDLDTTSFIKVFGPASELVPAHYLVHLKPAFRESQNLLRRDQSGDIHLIAYNHRAQKTGLGWYFANSATDLTASPLSAGLPMPTAWVAVYEAPANFSSNNLQCYIFDPVAEEGSMADQEVLRKELATELPEWDTVHRLYEDQFDLPARDRNEPDLKQFNASRFRDAFNAGQHVVTLSGHGWMDSCCNVVDNRLADSLGNGASRSIVYVDSCLTSRFTQDSLSTHFVLSPGGGAVAYVGYTDESEMGLSKFFQRQFFRGLAQSGSLGIAFDARAQLLQPTSWDYDPTSCGPRRMILIGSLTGDPAMRLTVFGQFAIKSANGRYLSATAGGGLGHDAVRTDARLCGPWETFTLVPWGNSRYALRTLDGHYLTIDNGGGKATDAVHSNQTSMGAHELVQIIPRGAKVASLGTPNGQFISAVAGGGQASNALRTDASSAGTNELFSLEPRHGAGLTIHLKTSNGSYLSAIDGGGRSSDVLHSNAGNAGPWERFALMPLGCGEYAIKTANGHYLTAINGGGRTTDVVRSDATHIGAWERFTVLPQGMDQLVLQTCDGHYLTFMDGGGRSADVVHSNAVAIGPWEKLTMVANMAFQTSNGCFLTAEKGGGVTTDALHSNATDISVFEKFTLLPLGTQCALQSADGHYLTAVNGGGRTIDVMHSDAIAIGPHERYTVVPLANKKVALQTIDGHYLTAVNGGGRSTDVVHTDALSIGPWEQFTLVAQGNGRHALKTATGNYLTVVGGGSRNQDAVHTDTSVIGAHEQLLLIPIAGEQFALRTAGGQFVTAVDGGGRTVDAVHTDATRVGPFERFNLVPLGAGRFALQTMNGCFLTAVDGGGKTTDVVHTDARAIGPWEAFVLIS